MPLSPHLLAIVHTTVLIGLAKYESGLITDSELQNEISHCISVNQSTNLENKMLIGLVLFDSL
ncbi:predicted protein [Pyrenophora tritici-repentis Pt-1C-BFP]|uniref:Uncharacterized protein n=1 Tax=Pyrenophora tritici-repentis (strain Pt-1C-BFP) TaxID=426418 RepID=B2VR35_PYRTR|nr:uncharacterized protein PTRG_00384 [Pyrenophora tritici-repentis Pt-1C-BFP]EDU39822.1 predicted protein [Pyrenophora tritici-repentis Pt-1C-BFP]